MRLFVYALIEVRSYSQPLPETGRRIGRPKYLQTIVIRYERADIVGGQRYRHMFDWPLDLGSSTGRV